MDNNIDSVNTYIKADFITYNIADTDIEANTNIDNTNSIDRKANNNLKILNMQADVNKVDTGNTSATNGETNNNTKNIDAQAGVNK